jgi:hypothetical protein
MGSQAALRGLPQIAPLSEPCQSKAQRCTILQLHSILQQDPDGKDVSLAF